jgi:glycosyltransferase involved in cell wall biosynthesis
LSHGETRPLRFLWFGSYSRGAGYPRNDTLVEGLRELGHEVHEVHVPLFRDASQRVALGRGGGFLRTAWRQKLAAIRLALGWFRAQPHDVAVAGSGGLMDALILRFLQNVQRTPLVHDAFIPLYDTVVRDRQLASPGSLRARTLRRLEAGAARVADVVLCDTAANAELFAEDYPAAAPKTAIVPIAQRDPGDPAPLPAAGGPLRVLLVATYIPLHGVETVIESARLLRGDGVEVTIVGTGQEFGALEARARGAPGLTLVPHFEPFAEVCERLARSHVGLGVFGDTAKAARVVPLKAALVLSAGRALVTRAGPAAEAALTGAAELIPPADPAALAAALRALRDDRARLTRLATVGRERFLERFTPRAAAEALVRSLQERGLVPPRG